MYVVFVKEKNKTDGDVGVEESRSESNLTIFTYNESQKNKEHKGRKFFTNITRHIRSKGHHHDHKVSMY